MWQPNGRVDTYDGVTGTVVGEATLPTVAAAPVGGVRAAGDLLVVFTPGPDATLLSAYRYSGLGLAWQRRLPAPDTVPASRMAYQAPATACGPMLCVQTTHDVTVLDPATGELSWRYVPPVNMTAGAGVLVGNDRADPGRLRVVDWRTGGLVRNPSGWTVVPAFEDSPPTTTVLVRKVDGGSTLLGAVDLRTGGLRLLGVVSVPPSRCVLGANRLACTASSGTTRLWRLG
jgi:hypothetical protein